MKGSYWISGKSPMCQFIGHILDPEEEYAIIVEKGKHE